MIIIQRKSDRKYYRNPSFAIARKTGHYTNWNYLVGTKSYFKTQEDYDKAYKIFEDARWSLKIEDCIPFKSILGAKSARDLSRNKFNELYEVIEVKMEINK